MNVLRTGANAMQVPSANAAMLGNRVLHDGTLLRIQGQSRLGHEAPCGLLALSVGSLKLAGFRDPAALVAG
jgi:hypothetical protein